MTSRERVPGTHTPVRRVTTGPRPLYRDPDDSAGVGVNGRLFDADAPHVDRFGVLLAVSVTAVAVESLVDLRASIGSEGGELGSAAFNVFVGATVLLSLRAAGVARRWRIAGDVLVGLSLLGSVGLLLADLVTESDLGVFGADAPASFWVALSAIAPTVVIARLLQHDHISRGTLLGAVAAFLLIALFFSFVYLTISHHQQAEFFGQPEPTTSYVYFSLVTITTLGYGDLSPTTELGRLFATAEAVIGQVYLVTFVAFLVSLYATRRRDNMAPPEPSPAEPAGAANPVVETHQDAHTHG